MVVSGFVGSLPELLKEQGCDLLPSCPGPVRPNTCLWAHLTSQSNAGNRECHSHIWVLRSLHMLRSQMTETRRVRGGQQGALGHGTVCPKGSFFFQVYESFFKISVISTSFHPSNVNKMLGVTQKVMGGHGVGGPGSKPSTGLTTDGCAVTGQKQELRGHWATLPALLPTPRPLLFK